MGSVHIKYRQRWGITPEMEMKALVSTYSYILHRAEERKAAGHDGGKNAEKGPDDDARRSAILPE